MKKIAISALCIFSAISTMTLADETKAHTHIKQLMINWSNTSIELGLLPIAIKEAHISSLYIQLSKVNNQDLAWIKHYIKKTRNSLRYNLQQDGGLGVGLVKALYAIARQTKSATLSPDASINIKLRSEQIINSVYNTAAVAKKMIRICQEIENSNSTAQALELITQLESLSIELSKGSDINNDGKISAHDHEGGLDLAAEQLTIMARAEGLIKTTR